MFSMLYRFQQQAFIPAAGSLITEISFCPFSKVELEVFTNWSASFNPTAFLIVPYKSPRFVILSKSPEISACFCLISGAYFYSASERALIFRHAGMLSRRGSDGRLFLMVDLISYFFCYSILIMEFCWSLSLESLVDLSLLNCCWMLSNPRSCYSVLFCDFLAFSRAERLFCLTEAMVESKLDLMAFSLESNSLSSDPAILLNSSWT